jgi:sodium/hydrogen antiporter
MDANQTFFLGCVIFGALLIAKTLGSSFIARLPLSSAMLYLAAGVAIGPWGWDLFKLDAFDNALLIERLAEIAVLISLFTVGMKFELKKKDSRWRIPVQLATVSMVITVGLIATAGVFLLNLPWGAAVLLGGILAPTDPVLASDVQMANTTDRDRLRLGLTGEGGLNDGTAFPFIMLGLGMLGLHELGENAWRWWTIDVVWSVAGGLAIGYILGLAVGRAIIYLRTRHREALGSDEFIALGLIALAYGIALLSHTYGFLAVFAAGVALRRIDDIPVTPLPEPAPEPVREPEAALKPELSEEDIRATGAEAPAHMMRQVERFNSQLDSFVEVGMVLIVGVLLASVQWDSRFLWFVPLLFLVIRPVAVALGLMGTDAKPQQRRLMAWFGIRGIGSLYYLMYAINHELDRSLAEPLLSVTLVVIVCSVVLHGVSVTPLMQRYEARKQSRRRPGNA